MSHTLPLLELSISRQPLFSFLEIKKKLKQASNNWWLLKYKNGADKNVGVKEIGYVEEN